MSQKSHFLKGSEIICEISKKIEDYRRGKLSVNTSKGDQLSIPYTYIEMLNRPKNLQNSFFRRINLTPQFL